MGPYCKVFFFLLFFCHVSNAEDASFWTGKGIDCVDRSLKLSGISVIYIKLLLTINNSYRSQLILST